ncbi:endonuclease [Sphingomonas sp. Leaf33]|uniref:endonuclease/exonuclease/phosphatase family protein n=1 Tax=Sphingomonas sp. Leaf33 TaxID=1736215 RepID=UPI0006FDEBB0|nr:endonuclease/exonuclease/phosphatase family protein [Sphingomonas sp. Leaf33]KQN19369.1 endonuclease [Sphingomonas sp. Leaf33]
MRAAPVFAALPAILLAAAPATAQSLRVMTFNVRLPMESDGANRWEARRDLAARTIARTRPAVIGTQELFQRQGDDLTQRLPGYRWFGIDRRGGHADEHMGVLYDMRRLTLIDSGQFWLSDTPDVLGSITWGHPLPRMVTWGIFERQRDKRRFRLLNTHFPYRAEDEAAREKGARLILAKLDTLPGAELPTVLTGDFNTVPDSATHAALADRLSDAWTTSRRRTGPDKTFHGFTGKADRRIDWIFTRGFTPTRVETLTDHQGVVWASDHFPVIADLKFAN